MADKAPNNTRLPPELMAEWESLAVYKVGPARDAEIARQREARAAQQLQQSPWNLMTAQQYYNQATGRTHPAVSVLDKIRAREQAIYDCSTPPSPVRRIFFTDYSRIMRQHRAATAVTWNAGSCWRAEAHCFVLTMATHHSEYSEMYAVGRALWMASREYDRGTAGVPQWATRSVRVWTDHRWVCENLAANEGEVPAVLRPMWRWCLDAVARLAWQHHAWVEVCRVPGHEGVRGNAAADKIAREGAAEELGIWAFEEWDGGLWHAEKTGGSPFEAESVDTEEQSSDEEDLSSSPPFGTPAISVHDLRSP